MENRSAPNGTSPYLAGLADAVLQPGFVGTTLPDWVRRRLSNGLGGIALYSRNLVDSEQTRALTAAIRAANPHTIIAVDEEGGDVTRLEAWTGSSRPGNLALGAADDPALTELVARGLGRDLALAGFNLNYAPVVDVNSDLDNPVVDTRSFGSDPLLVARHTAAWVSGLQSAGVAACAKHFPGHGATAADSHDELPTVAFSVEELAATALPPFRAAIAAGARAVMTGHLLVPAYDPDSPATTSRRLLVDLLRQELGFEGLIVTDGIEMPAVSGRYGMANATVSALVAGADAVCVGGQYASVGIVGLLRNAIMAAVVDGTLPEKRLAEAAERVRSLADWSAAHTSRAAHIPQGAHTATSGPADATSDTTGTSDTSDTSDTSGTTGTGDADAALTAARRARRVTVHAMPSPSPGEPPHVIELDSPTNLAVDPVTPWGMAAPLAALIPGTTSARLTEPDAEELAKAVAAGEGRLLVLTVRSAHRHAWVRDALDLVLARRPDAVVVEMGLPGRESPGAVHVATFGATLVCAQVAVDALAELGLLAVQTRAQETPPAVQTRAQETPAAVQTRPQETKSSSRA